MLARLLMICSLAMGATAAHGQFYALPQGYAVWVEAGWVGPGYPHYGYYHTYDPASPDTVINGVVYKNWGGMPVRESGTGQVYFRRPFIDDDLLWYDYDVQVGDTVQFGETMGFPAVNAVRVVSVDTISVVGTPRKRVGVAFLPEQGDWPCAHWIQGIGSTVGLFNMCAGPSVSGGRWLVCMSVDGIVQYGQNEGQAYDCMVHIGVDEQMRPESPLELFPNPGSVELNVSYGKATGSAVIRVFSMHGDLVHAQAASSTVRLSTENWPSGVYIVEAVREGFATKRGRWVKIR